MNLPEYSRALETAFAEHEQACLDAKERLQKALYVAKEEFFQDRDAIKAVEVEDVPRGTRY